MEDEIRREKAITEDLPAESPRPKESGLALDLFKIASNPDWKEMLVDIVTGEKMDPWDIDISLLTLRFLENIKRMKELDFRIPANAILASSILLRFKSDSWTLLEEEVRFDEGIYIPDQLITEPIIPELIPITRITKRKVTLDELISSIEDAIKKEKKKATKSSVQSLIPKTLIDIVEQDENFEKRLEDMYKKVRTMVDKDNLVLFSQLLKEKSVEEMIDHFVPLLHLANKQKLYLWQEKIFGDIFIYLPENGEAPPIKKQDLEEKVEIPKKTKVKKRIKNEREETG